MSLERRKRVIKGEISQSSYTVISSQYKGFDRMELEVANGSADARYVQALQSNLSITRTRLVIN
jgi:hypothetical protein